MGFTGQMT